MVRELQDEIDKLTHKHSLVLEPSAPIEIASLYFGMYDDDDWLENEND